jgi:pyruvate dehydrogenase E2 component (dihydrolipoamide acetyltransferase)
LSTITPIKMPKWGLLMEEGTVIEWHVAPGGEVREGDKLVEIETSKLANEFESPFSGTLRRQVAAPGDTLPVGALIGIMADNTAGDAEIDAFIAEFNVNFVPGETDEAAAGPVLQTLETAAGNMRVGHLGREHDSTPAFLIHGFGGDINNWMLTLDALSAERPVYAVDLPGHGGSTKQVGDGNIAVLSNAVGGALDALSLDRVHLVGHSLGGIVALNLAGRHAERVASLCLVCAPLPGGTLNRDYLRGFIEARRTRDLKKVVEILFDDPEFATRELVDDLVKYKRVDGVVEALKTIEQNMAGSEDQHDKLAEKLAELTVPLLIVAAHGDRIVGAPDPAKLPASAKLHWIESASHMPQIEHADELNAWLNEFMQ